MKVNRHLYLLPFAFCLFVVLATLNSAGYRYGASDQALYVPSVLLKMDPALYPQDRVLISRAEYGANAIALLQLQRRTGCQLVLVDDDEHGQIDLGALETALAADDTAMVSLVHVRP